MATAKDKEQTGAVTAFREEDFTDDGRVAARHDPKVREALHKERQRGLEKAEEIQTDELLEGKAPRYRLDDPRPREEREAEVARVRSAGRGDDAVQKTIQRRFKGEKLVSVYIPLDPGEKLESKPSMFVGLNGNFYLVAKGRPVNVPESIARIIFDKLNPEPVSDQAKNLGPLLFDQGNGPGVEIGL